MGLTYSCNLERNVTVNPRLNSRFTLQCDQINPKSKVKTIWKKETHSLVQPRPDDHTYNNSTQQEDPHRIPG